MDDTSICLIALCGFITVCYVAYVSITHGNGAVFATAIGAITGLMGLVLGRVAMPRGNDGKR